MANAYRPAAQFRAELRRFLRRSEDCARANGLTPRQHLLLLQIAGSPDGVARVSDLVGLLSLTQSAVTELVQRAEEAGLVLRSQSTLDGRVVDLRLSPEGERRLAAVHRTLGPERQALHAMLESLDRRE
jgi:DNA-binding MarR family transcriptional regulator